MEAGAEKNNTKSDVEVDCPICYRLMVEPSRYPCNHATCMTCVDTVLDQRPRCPICRAEVPENFVPQVDKYLQHIVQKSNPEEFAKLKAHLDEIRMKEISLQKIKIECELG